MIYDCITPAKLLRQKNNTNDNVVKRNFCQVKRSFLPVSCIRSLEKERCKELQYI
jgi:hypothetical protein